MDRKPQFYGNHGSPMLTLQKEFLDFTYREISVPLRTFFPKLQLLRQFEHCRDPNPHQTILNVIRDLWNGGYEQFLDKNGFWDEAYAKFSGHCHQCTPILGAALKSLGFEVSYLECIRIREHFPTSGKIEKVPPQEEPNPEVREEFRSINRIPYCCLEVIIDGKPHYITGKHVKPSDAAFTSLLSPSCFQEVSGLFRHPQNPHKSGIYLRSISPRVNSQNLNFSRQVVWTKQTAKDKSPEFFATFLRMRLL